MHIPLTYQVYFFQLNCTIIPQFFTNSGSKALNQQLGTNYDSSKTFYILLYPFTALSISITVYRNDLLIRKMSSTGVRFPGLTHPGIVGTAPSVELLNIWNEREKKLAESGTGSMKLCEVVHQRPLANLPTPRNCLLGKVTKNVENTEDVM